MSDTDNTGLPQQPPAGAPQDGARPTNADLEARMREMRSMLESLPDLPSADEMARELQERKDALAGGITVPLRTTGAHSAAAQTQDTAQMHAPRHAAHAAPTAPTAHVVPTAPGSPDTFSYTPAPTAGTGNYVSPSGARTSSPAPDQMPIETISSFEEIPERRGMGCGGGLLLILLAVGLSVLIRLFVGEPFYVPSGSMLETIQIGDRLFGEKISYRFRSPERGEVVTFHDPAGTDVLLIKRVIATQGETVDFVDGVVYVNGAPLDEPYTNGLPSEPFSSTASFLEEPLVYPYTVPEGCIWVMGDNRVNSQDSRYFGPVEVDSVTSRGVVIFWPPEDFGTL